MTVSRSENHLNKLKQFYIAHLEGLYEPSRIFIKGKLKDWFFNLWCLHPAIGMQRLMEDKCITKPRSLIITSGTLEPIQKIEDELEIPFKIKESFNHVIGSNQLKIFVFNKSPSGYSLEPKFEDIKKDEYKLELGKTLLPLIRVLPFGTLVFFPSYSLLGKCLDYWKTKSSIWRDMSSSCGLFIENSAKSQVDFLNDVNNYKQMINDKRRAVYFCVCRGKLSEGMNLQGNHCRTVIITGLPYPNYKDHRVKEIIEFNKSKRNDDKWYNRQMSRALNQTVGRIIRSKDDFGLVILCDPRFQRYKYSLSRWTYEYLPPTFSNYADVEKELKEFFGSHEINITGSIAENHGAFELNLSTQRPSQQSAQQSSSQQQQKRHQQMQQSQQKQAANNVEKQTPALPVADFRSQIIASYPRRDDGTEGVPIRRLEPARAAPKSGFEAICDYGNDESEPERQQPAVEKRRKTANIFYRAKNVRTLTNTTSTTDGENNLDYSIIRHHNNEMKRPIYSCYICKNDADKPMRTNCDCARIGCKDCLMNVFRSSKKQCGTCKTLLRPKEFKRLEFGAN